MPSPILPYHVQLILQYICPPSELENPVPSHLLSRALYQRQVFLEIEPANAAVYLCWQEASRERVISLLESLQQSTDYSSASFVAAYTTDEENTFAHVHLPTTGPDGLRLVFDWDERDASWKFHNTDLMPFPRGAGDTLDTVMSSETLEESSPDDPVSPESPEEDDSYWNAYGGPDDEDENSLAQVDSASSQDIVNDSEDAYWAQYSTIHGTADSTIPTPPRQHGKHIPAPEAPLPIPPAMMIRPRAGPRDPVSPATLAARLGEITPRDSLPVSVAHSPLNSTYNCANRAFAESNTASLETPAMADAVEQVTPSSTQTRERTLSEGSSGSRAGSQTSGPPNPISPTTLRGPNTAVFHGGPEDDSVCEVVRGAYRLWRAVHANTASRDDFLRLVASATDGL